MRVSPTVTIMERFRYKVLYRSFSAGLTSSAVFPAERGARVIDLLALDKILEAVLGPEYDLIRALHLDE
jgi:hypothetical protein